MNNILTNSKHLPYISVVLLFIVSLLLGSYLMLADAGALSRSQTSTLVSDVTAYENALLKYKQTFGDYPQIEGEAACLGSSYAATTVFTSGVCFKNGYGYSASINDYFTNELKKVSPKLPNRTYQTVSGAYISGPSIDSRGIMFQDDVDTLTYYLHSGQTCPKGVQSNLIGINECMIALPQ